jgi:hypothetical protein
MMSSVSSILCKYSPRQPCHFRRELDQVSNHSPVPQPESNLLLFSESIGSGRKHFCGWIVQLSKFYLEVSQVNKLVLSVGIIRYRR